MTCCFGPFTPELRRLYFHVNDWTQFTIRDNIEAVPYCENSADLNRVKELAATYRESLMKNPNTDKTFQSKTLNLLQNLDTTADRRLKELPYINTANKIRNLLGHFGNIEDSTSWVQMLTEARAGLNTTDQEIISLRKNIRAYHKDNSSHLSHLKELNALLELAENALTNFTANENPDYETSSINDDSHIKSSSWNRENIETFRNSLPEMNIENLSRLIEQIRQQKTAIQKQLVANAEELKWLNRSLDLVNNNKTLWHQLHQKFEDKVQKFTHAYSPTPSDKTQVELELEDVKT
jgi:hypothetical protein